MKNALIDPRMPAIAITGWDSAGQPIYSSMPNTGRVAQVEVDTFPVADPLFWTECADATIADFWYYDQDTKEVKEIPVAPKVAADNQPTASGVQTL